LEQQRARRFYGAAHRSHSAPLISHPCSNELGALIRGKVAHQRRSAANRCEYRKAMRLKCACRRLSHGPTRCGRSRPE
jgi:hypothetical protein